MTVLTEMAIRIDLTDIPLYLLIYRKAPIEPILLLFLFLNFLFYDLTKVLLLDTRNFANLLNDPNPRKVFFTF